jgi:hypothetical protein
MRHAAGLLFGTALILFAAGLVPFLYELGASFSRKASNLGDTSGDLSTMYPLVIGAFAGAVWPLFGAALLYRMDKREQVRAVFGANND